MAEYIKSCLNYTGGKYRLLKQIIPLFPDNVETFVDLFCGGGNVGINIDCTASLFNDKNYQLISLFNTLKELNFEEVKEKVDKIIKQYGLSQSDINGYEYYKCDSAAGLAPVNKEKYLELRKKYNELIKEDNCDIIQRDLLLYVLTIYGFNNQIRFNKKQEFNIPVGKRDFNSNIQSNLKAFMEAIHKHEAQFTSQDFREINLNQLGPNDFVYADPPYLITTATYNEQNGWTEKDEQDLLNLLDTLNARNIKFALSNVLENKGRVNEILLEWSKKYKVHDLNHSYSNSNYQVKDRDSITREVLITNY